MSKPARFLALAVLATCAIAQPVYTIQTVAGGDFNGDGGPALQALLNQTEGVAVDNSGSVYVADADANRVRKITADGTIQTIAGTGTAGFSGDGAPAVWARLNHPYGVALDAAGNLYIADLGNARIRKVTTDGMIETIAGGGTIVPGLNGDGGAATSVQLLQPRNVATSFDGSIYFSDFGTNRVFRISTAGILTTVAGNGNGGFGGDGGAATLAQLKAPAGVAVDSSGAIYVADSGNNRIRRVFQGAISTIFSVTAPTGIAVSPNGTIYVAAANYAGTTTRALAGIASAKDVAVGSAGNVFASVGQYVWKISSDGKLSTVAGSGASPYFAGDGGPALNARLHGPSGVALDSGGNLYIADTANNRVRKVNPAGVISTVIQSQLSAPRSVAVDGQQNLYVADTGNNRILKIASTGTLTTLPVQVSAPDCLAVDGAGAIYIADKGNNRVVRVSSSGTVSTLTQILQPAAVAVDGSGNVFASGTSSVVKIAGLVSTVLDGLNSPAGLAVDSSGNLWIAENGSNAVRLLDPSGIITTIAGGSDLNSPTGLAPGANGTVYVADTGNNRIRVLTPQIASDSSIGISVVHSATLLPGPVAPGEIVTIFGSGFDPADTQLQFDGEAGLIFYLGQNQINALVPLDLRPGLNSLVRIVVKNTTIATAAVSVAASVPGFFTIAGGTGQIAANNENGSVNSSSNPADRGSVVSLYATGQGNGLGSLELKIGGYVAEMLYAGAAPGFPGLMQINARIPGGFAPIGILPVVLTVASTATQAGVTIAVR